MRSAGGYTLAELLLALGMIAIVVLAVLGLAISSSRANQKVSDTTAGQLVADQALERLAYAAESTTTTAFWASPAGLYSDDQLSMGQVDYHLRVYQVDVVDADRLFAVPGHRLRRLEAHVEWLGAETGKVGRGVLRVQAVRLVHEP